MQKFSCVRSVIVKKYCFLHRHHHLRRRRHVLLMALLARHLVTRIRLTDNKTINKRLLKTAVLYNNYKKNACQGHQTGNPLR